MNEKPKLLITRLPSSAIHNIQPFQAGIFKLPSSHSTLSFHAPRTAGLIAIYFDKSQAIAYSIKNLIVNLGIVAGAASLFDCVYSEIYLQMGALVTAAISYAVAELLHRRMKTCVKEIIPL